MKVALIGASGFVGKSILNELINRGYLVTAISRNPENVVQIENVKAVTANALDANEVAEAVKGHDAVISAYNAGWTNPNIYNEFLQGSKAIQKGVKKAGVKRLIVVGGGGSLYVAEGLQLVDTPEFPQEFKAGASSARDYLNILKEEKELEWTFLSPAIEMHQGTVIVFKLYKTKSDIILNLLLLQNNSRSLWCTALLQSISFLKIVKRCPVILLTE